jgi:uncharacterized protein YndB with AHSA1/START domain
MANAIHVTGQSGTRGPVIDKPSLRLERYFDVAPEKVWRAWTDPKALTAWFGTGEDGSVILAETDVRIGGRFHVVFRMPDGEQHDVSGKYLQVVPVRKLVFTWAWKSTPERESLVTVSLEPTDNKQPGGQPAAQGTRMTFLHEQFYDQKARDDHEGGWTLTFEKLARYFL